MEVDAIYKVCTICKEEKGLWEFQVDKKTPDGTRDYCKDCRQVQIEKEKIKKEQKKIQREIDQEERRIKYLILDEEKEARRIKREAEARLKKNKLEEERKLRVQLKPIQEKKREERKIKLLQEKELERENLKKTKELEKERKKNRLVDLQKTLDYFTEQILLNEERTKAIKLKNKIIQNVRGLIGSSIKKRGYKKDSRTEKILGCSFEEFKKYIEEQFDPWMNWYNHGRYTGKINETWHFDHIIPLASADTKKEVIKLCHYTNFQPLCSYINQAVKKDKILHEGEYKHYKYFKPDLKNFKG